jgi:hypothetical protein
MIPIRMHMAAGDTIVQGGLIVELHKRCGRIAVPSYKRNDIFVQSLFRAFIGISFYLVPEFYPWGAPPNWVFDQAMEDAGLDKSQEIRLGSYHGYCAGTEGAYIQAGVHYEKRWTSCPVENAAKYVNQLEWHTDNRIFYHDDPDRNFLITKIVDKKSAFFPIWTPNILSYVNILKTAEEIHAIDSAFFCLASQLTLKAKLFFHRYARIDPTVIPEPEWEEIL